MIAKDRIRALLEQYIAGTITRQDFDELHGYLLSGDGEDELATFMKAMLEEMELDEHLPVSSDRIYKQLVNHVQFAGAQTARTPKRQKVVNWGWVGGVAALLCVAIGLSLYHGGDGVSLFTKQQQTTAEDIRVSDSPDHPTLRLADGTIVNLDSIEAGLLATQGDTRVEFNGNELVYKTSGIAPDEPPVYNTIMIPKGKQYQIALPDGSKVWLNTGTSLTYPVQFTGDQRVVQVNGEAYFEVVHHEKMPFIVKSDLQEVEVLGTSFNVSCYGEDGMIRTTLVEGKVRINGPNGRSATLEPGEQAIVARNNHGINVRYIDPEEVISWKHGLFVFNNEAIADVMKKVSRWYDVEVVFQDDMEGKLIGGTIPQFNDIEKLMDALQATGLLRYKMEGGEIIIMK